MLPTGDRVTVLPNGNASIEPAEGREDIGFVTPQAFDGSDELIAVPFDMVDDIEAGLEDPRRYNVTRLLGAGQTDAGAAPASALDDRAYTGLLPDPTGESGTVADEAQKFSVILRDRTGGVPDDSWAMWATRDGSDFGGFAIDADGVGSEAFMPGDYIIVTQFRRAPTDTERGELVLGITPVTVGDGQGQLLVDATTAQPVSAEVERDDAVYVGAPISYGALSRKDESFGLAASAVAEAGSDIYLMPEPDLPEFELSLMYQPTFLSPEGSADPYTYNLALGELDGFPADTEYAFTDDELAQVETHLHDLGAAVRGHTCDYGDFVERQTGIGLCRRVPVAFPSTHTMLYTAEPGISWEHSAKGGIYAEGTQRIVDGFVDDRTGVVYEPGRTERTVVKGPFSAGAPVVARSADEAGGHLIGGLLYPGFSVGGESLAQVGFDGTMSLSRDGRLVSETEGVQRFVMDMPAEPGRYTLAAESVFSGTTSVFAAASSQSWSFDVGEMPEEGYEYLDLPVVSLGIEGAEGGWVDGDEPVEVTLQAMAGAPYAPVEVESMTFEVSYDDGRTWRNVAIERDGGTAAGVLCPPRRAEFVSVRMTAVDTAGTEVAHTTIRSFGLA
ncbi:hypothetical protein AB0K52_09000 [Glycomyces sp. NPDC049804]|uniref:hypothetical protein n=1 Tax=Glycomyces sp. NPDC049804 TaxID=3154363 RepID=UPI00341EB768